MLVDGVDLGIIFGAGLLLGVVVGLASAALWRRSRLRRRSPDLGTWACLVRDYDADAVEQGSSLDGQWRGVRWIRPEGRKGDG